MNQSEVENKKENKWRHFVKNEWVLLIATAAALLSMLLVPPSEAYWSYVDFRVLGILFCLMAVVVGFIKAGLFDVLSQRLLSKTRSIQRLSMLLVGCCFFSSMLVTNDVALLTFVPLTLGILGFSGQKRLIFVVVLETVAANLGSMLTPVGNPQNLYLYSFYQMELWEFLKIVAPICSLGFLILCGLLLFVKDAVIAVSFPSEMKIGNKGRFWGYVALFFLCIATVLQVVDYRICLSITILAIYFLDKHIFKRVDYSLLLTFVAFFIFVGNLSAVESVRTTLSTLMEGREFFVSVLLSQIVSNVPAAIMLSGFTSNIKALLVGVNVGGLGTLVASLASLISFKLYAKSEGARPWEFLRVFTLCNVGILLVLYMAAPFL